MGPVMEYATEKAADSIELRIYPGADGKFVYYEDENDNYNYEKGQSATIGFSWNDLLRQLTISGRKGSFPGMLTSRVFNVVIVQKGKGIGELAAATADRMVKYSGKELVVTFP